jgi:hypothetical protein
MVVRFQWLIPSTDFGFTQSSPPTDLYLWIETLELEISVKHREVLKHNFSTIHYLARDIRRYTPPCHLCKTFGYHLKKYPKILNLENFF